MLEDYKTNDCEARCRTGLAAKTSKNAELRKPSRAGAQRPTSNVEVRLQCFTTEMPDIGTTTKKRAGD
jgi:hypothetical protein